MVNSRIKYDPKAVYSVKDFLKKGILITGVIINKEQNCYRIWFRGENLFAEIRMCYHGKWAVDTKEASEGWCYKRETCQSTECRTMREAKSLVWSWFESKGWHQIGRENFYFSPMIETSHYKPIIEYFL